MNASVQQQSHIYIHQRSESLVSKVLKTFMSLAGLKGTLGKTLASGKIKNDPAPIPKSFAKKYTVDTQTFEGRELWTIGPKNGQSKQLIFYIPGGAYVFSIVGLHWNFLSKILDRTNTTVVIANYPVAPQATAETTYSYMKNLYKKVLGSHYDKEIIFMGDSAGGGLAIAFAQFLETKNLQQPKQIITLSPWLDITMSNPDIAAVDKDDKAMNVESLRQAGKMYAGNIPDTDPRVSPIYGSFTGLAKMSIFIGTHDLFIADARKLKAKLEQQNISFNYYEYPKMIHTWMLMPVKESKATVTQVLELLKR